MWFEIGWFEYSISCSTCFISNWVYTILCALWRMLKITLDGTFSLLGFMLPITLLVGKTLWMLLYYHQHNVSLSVGACVSIWVVSDQNPRVVKSQSWLDQRGGHLVQQGVLANNLRVELDWYSRLQVKPGALAINLWEYKRTRNNLRSMWEYGPQALERLGTQVTSLVVRQTTCHGGALT